MNAPESPTPILPAPDETVGAGIDFSDPNSPLAPVYLRTSHVVAVAAVLAVFVIGTRFPLWHTDVWGHVKYGQWMVQNRAVPDREPFCPWWDDRLPFTQFYTISQTAMYLTYAAGEGLAGGDELNRMAGGVEFLRASHGLLTAARFAVLLVAFWRLTRSVPMALVGMLGVLFLDLSNLAVFRPQVFGQLLFALLLVPLSRDRLSWRAVAVLPLMLAVWANTHGSFLVGMGVLGLLLAGRVIERVKADGVHAAWTDEQARRLAIALATSFVAVGVLNPYGFSYYKRTLDLGKHPSLLTAVGEWQPLAFEWAIGWHWVLLVSLVVIAVTLIRSRKSIPPGHLLMLLAFGVWVALQNRWVIWWAMVVPWVLLPHWAEMAARSARRFPDGSLTFKKTLLAAAVAVALFMWSSPAGWLIYGTPTPVETALSDGTPWQLARQVARPAGADEPWSPELDDVLWKHYPKGEFTGAILATPMQGDYLMWSLAPRVAVTYSHIHLFHPDFWTELGIVGSGQPGWWDVLDKYGVNLIVAESDFAPELLAEVYAAPGWVVVLDETKSPDKPQPLNRQFVAVRRHPIRPSDTSR